MENPASWTELTHKIDAVIRSHKADEDAGVIGGSLAMYLQESVFEPEIARLTREIEEARDACRAIDDLFREPLCCLLRKMHGPLTNGDQGIIDAAFLKLRAVLAPEAPHENG